MHVKVLVNVRYASIPIISTFHDPGCYLRYNGDLQGELKMLLPTGV